MYFVYVLRSEKDRSLYISYTTNIKQRLLKHKNKEVISTKHKAPLKILFFEAFNNKPDAKNRELYLKSGWGRKSLQKLLRNTL